MAWRVTVGEKHYAHLRQYPETIILSGKYSLLQRHEVFNLDYTKFETIDFCHPYVLNVRRVSD